MSVWVWQHSLPFGFYLASGNTFIFRFYQFHLTWWSKFKFHPASAWIFVSAHFQSWHIKLIPIIWIWPTIDFNHIICKMDLTTKFLQFDNSLPFNFFFSPHDKNEHTHTKRHKSHDNNWLSFVIHVVATFFFKSLGNSVSLSAKIYGISFFQLYFISLCSSYQSYIVKRMMEYIYASICNLKIR